MRGKTGSNWWISGNDLFLNMEISGNTMAIIYVTAICLGRHNIYDGQSLLMSNDEESKKQDDTNFGRKNQAILFLRAVPEGMNLW